MSQFERDLHLAIQQSLEEEKKKQEESNQNNSQQNSNATPQVQNSNTNNIPKNTNDVKMDVEDDEEAELEKARLMSIEEHDGLLKKKEEEDSN